MLFRSAQAGIKIAGRNINNLRYAGDTTLMAESEEELKSLVRVKQESETIGLKLNIQKTNSMASHPITSLQIDGGEMETVTDFIFLDSKITVDGDCSHEIKTLAAWKKSYDRSRQHIKNQRHHFAAKGPYIQSSGFPVVMYGCESWTIKKAEHQRVDSFKSWCRRRLLRISDCKEIKPVNPKGNQP